MFRLPVAIEGGSKCLFARTALSKSCLLSTLPASKAAFAACSRQSSSSSGLLPPSSGARQNSSTHSSFLGVIIAAVAGSAAVALLSQSDQPELQNADVRSPPIPVVAAGAASNPSLLAAQERVPPPLQHSLSELAKFYSIPFEPIEAACMKSDAKDSMSYRMDVLVHQLQNDIAANIDALEHDEWSRHAFEFRPQGPALLNRRDSPMGRKYTMEGGMVFEKAGVNTTVIRRDFTLEDVTAMLRYNPEGHEKLRKWYDNYAKSEKFNQQVKIPLYTASISLVLQPRNPHCPTVHANYRHFEYLVPDEHTGTPRNIWWFAGGQDLTPMTVVDEDTAHFHRMLYRVCRKHSTEFYPKFKKWADDYFDITHRAEKRGVGGIFFDDLTSPLGTAGAEDTVAKEKMFGFIGDCAKNFSSSYFPLVATHRWDPYVAADREWQLWRRSRYPEFVLVYDRGTTHGFNTVKKQRTVEEKNLMSEYILMSLPPVTTWKINRQPKNDKEKYTLQVLRYPKDWIDPKVEDQAIAKEQAEKKK